MREVVEIIFPMDVIEERRHILKNRRGIRSSRCVRFEVWCFGLVDFVKLIRGHVWDFANTAISPCNAQLQPTFGFARGKDTQSITARHIMAAASDFLELI